MADELKLPGVLRRCPRFIMEEDSQASTLAPSSLAQSLVDDDVEEKGVKRDLEAACGVSDAVLLPKRLKFARGILRLGAEGPYYDVSGGEITSSSPSSSTLTISTSDSKEKDVDKVTSSSGSSETFNPKLWKDRLRVLEERFG